MSDTTGMASGALTVAGQRRIYTVFPNILVSLRDGLCANVDCQRAGRKLAIESVAFASNIGITLLFCLT
jgi:hypothetical protein